MINYFCHSHPLLVIYNWMDETGDRVSGRQVDGQTYMHTNNKCTCLPRVLPQNRVSEKDLYIGNLNRSKGRRRVKEKRRLSREDWSRKENIRQWSCLRYCKAKPARRGLRTRWHSTQDTINRMQLKSSPACSHQVLKELELLLYSSDREKLIQNSWDVSCCFNVQGTKNRICSNQNKSKVTKGSYWLEIKFGIIISQINSILVGCPSFLPHGLPAICARSLLVRVPQMPMCLIILITPIRLTPNDKCHHLSFAIPDSY